MFVEVYVCLGLFLEGEICQKGDGAFVFLRQFYLLEERTKERKDKRKKGQKKGQKKERIKGRKDKRKKGQKKNERKKGQKKE